VEKQKERREGETLQQNPAKSHDQTRHQSKRRSSLTDSGGGITSTENISALQEKGGTKIQLPKEKESGVRPVLRKQWEKSVLRGGRGGKTHWRSEEMGRKGDRG